MTRQIDSIIVHCSATPQSMDIGVEEIRKWHKEIGWLDIGYHYVIRRNGAVEAGRDEDIVGAHAEGHNKGSIGICLIGGTDAEDKGKAESNYTLAQYLSLADLVRILRDKYAVNAENVVGHRDLPGVKKSCPCFDVRAFFSEVGHEL